MDAVYSWCNGAKFSEICKVRQTFQSPSISLTHSNFKLIMCMICVYSQMTDVFEGSLIRVFRRLQELIRQMSMGAFIILAFDPILWCKD